MEQFSHPTFFPYRLLAAFGLLAISVFAQAQVNIIPKRTDVAGFATWTDAAITGTTLITLKSATSKTTTPVMDFTPYTTALTLDFKIRTFGGTNAAKNAIRLSISTNGSTWTTLNTYTPTTTTPTAVTQINLSVYGGSTTVQLRFETLAADGTIGAGIDDIDIKGTAPCTAPAAVTGASVAPTSATAISGSFATNTATGYLVVQSTTPTLSAMPTNTTNYAVNNAVGDGTVIANTTTGSFSKTGLTACTPYYYHIFAYNSTTCSGGPMYSAATITSVILACAASEIITYGAEPASVSSIKNGVILAATDGTEVWQFQIRDGNSTIDADILPTIMTDLSITKNASSSALFDAIQDAVLIDKNDNTIIAHATITASLDFSGLNVICGDDATKTLALRVTLKCPLPASSLDGSRFVFNITNSNFTTASAATSSQKMVFSAATSANIIPYKNVIDVVATQLTFTAQTSDTPTNEPMMPAVQVTATDACGNLDLDGNLPISLTSTGTPTLQSSATTLNGVATFSNIVHTAAGTGFALTATSGAATATSNLFDIQQPTQLFIGDMAMIGYDTYVGFGGDDKIMLTNLVDLAAGTTFTVANAVYEIGAMANERTNRWYSGNGGASGASGGGQNVAYIKFRTTAPIAKGSTICIRLLQLAGFPSAASDFTVNGTTNSNWKTSGTGFVNVNSSGRGDAIWLMQGNFTVSPTLDPNNYNYSTFVGSLLGAAQFNSYACVPSAFYQFEEDVPALDCQYANTTNRVSRIHPDLQCIGVGFSPSEAFYMAYNTAALHNDTQHNLLGSISNFSGNWTSAAYTTATDPGDNLGALCSAPTAFTVTQPLVRGRWLGNTGGTFDDRDWFFCNNWDNFQVPNETTNVIIPALATDGVNANTHAEIDATSSSYAAKYNNVATAKNLTINSTTAEVRAKLGSQGSILEVHGDLTIANGATLDLSTAAGDGGKLSLWGNWTNNNTTDKVMETGSQVYFMGALTQNMSNAAGTETLDNVFIQKDPTTLLNLNADLKTNALTFTSGGVVRTNTHKVHILDNTTTSLSGYLFSGSSDSYIQGNLRRNMLGATLYDFPVGDAVHECQLAALNFGTPSATMTYGEMNYVNTGSGAITEAPNMCDTDSDGDLDKVTYNQISGTWNISSDATNGALSCAVTLTPGGSNPYSMASVDNMRHSGANILNCGDAGFAEAGNTTQTVTHFSPFQMVSGIVTLPVKLLRLSAKANANSIVVTWTTATELNNNFFDIERSNNGTNWQKIGQQKGNGTTNTLHEYSFLDTKPQAGTNYYRLQQVDFDGKSSISQVVSAMLSQKQTMLISSNLVHNDLNISINAAENAGLATLEIVNINGSILSHQNLNLQTGMNYYTVNTTDFAAGVYLLWFKNGEYAHTIRFVKQ